MPALDALKKLGVEAKPRKSIGIYGPSMVGKSILAAMIASEWVGVNGAVVVFGSEEHYADEDYKSLIESLIKARVKYVNYCPTVQDVFKYMSIVHHRKFEGRLALILDSLSFIAMREQSKYVAMGYTEPRTYLPRVIPVLYSIASNFKRLLIEKEALGIVIMHAASTAGTKFRGLTVYRPSMAMRVAHSLDYLILMNSEGPGLEAPRVLTLIASRLNPLLEGSTVKVKFRGDTVELVEGGTK